MRSSRVLAVAVVSAVLSMFGGTAANAATVPGPYGSPAFNVDVFPGSVFAGGAFTATFTSTIPCSWTLNDFHGQTAPAGSGLTYLVNLFGPSSVGSFPITALCTWNPAIFTSAPATRSHSVMPAVYVATAKVSSDSLLAAPQTDPVTGTIKVIPKAKSDSGALPNTGGSNESLLVWGAGLVLVGAGVTVVARRRKTAA